MSTARSCVVLLMLALCAPASAQDQDATGTSPDSRAAMLAAEREQKAAETSPPQRSKIERALYRYDSGTGTPFIFQSWHGFQLASGHFPAGAGTSAGIGFTHALASACAPADSSCPNRVQVDAGAAYSTLGYSRARTGLKVQRLGGAPIAVGVSAQHYEFPQEDFFGLGPDSAKESRTNYLLRSTEVASELQWKPARWIEVGGGAAFLQPRIGSGTDNRYPTTERVFDPASVPGFETQPDFLRGDASVALDWRDNPLHPHLGGRYSMQLSDYRDQDLDSFSFRRVAIDLQQYVPVPNRYRTIALHAAAVLTDPRDGQQVPFYYQPTLGGAQALRGFREFRFQDQNSLLLTAEYRWEAWWALDGAVFVDAGKVAADRKDLTLRDLNVSYGVGFRIHSNSAFVARLDLAFSREGFIPLLRFEHAF